MCRIILCSGPANERRRYTEWSLYVSRVVIGSDGSGGDGGRRRGGDVWWWYDGDDDDDDDDQGSTFANMVE